MHLSVDNNSMKVSMRQLSDGPHYILDCVINRNVVKKRTILTLFQFSTFK
jgi:hypothetical protein